MKKIEKVVIIGSGPAGLAAAIYTARDGWEPLVVTGKAPGGQPMLTTEVEDYPGFPEGILGPELVARFRAQAERFGTRFLSESVVTINLKKKPLEIKTETETIFAKAVILAMGASPKWLGLSSERRLVGRGVSVCAVCDGAFFKNKNVAVIGGGDTAMREAQHLSRLASQVTIIHRRDALKAQQALQDMVKALPNVDFLFNSEVVEILGKEKVEGIKVKELKTGESRKLILDGVFLAIGYQPNTGVLQRQVKVDAYGYIVPKKETQTSVRGVFVAGDVADSHYRQIATSVGSGVKAALDVEEYLEKVKS